MARKDPHEMANKVAKVSKVSTTVAKVVLTDKSTDAEVKAFIEGHSKDVEVKRGSLDSVKKGSKRLFNFKRMGENRMKVVFRNIAYKAYFKPETKFSETYLKERDYYKRAATVTMSEFGEFVDLVFKVAIDDLVEGRIHREHA